MQKHYPHLNYIWVFSKPENNNIPGNATKIEKKDLKLIMMPMLKAKYWVTNARLPLYLNKRESNVYPNLARNTIKTFS